MAADFRGIIVALRGDRTLNFYCNSCQPAAFGSKHQTAVDEDLRSCRARTWILHSGDGQPADAGRLTVCKCLDVWTMTALPHRPQTKASVHLGQYWVCTQLGQGRLRVLLGLNVRVVLQLLSEVIKSSRTSVNMVYYWSALTRLLAAGRVNTASSKIETLHEHEILLSYFSSAPLCKCTHDGFCCHLCICWPFPILV